jgi:predicted dehydrogenase
MATIVKKRLGVVGCGQWGPNQIRTFFFHPHAEVTRICDTDTRRLDAMKSVYRHVETTTRFEDITRHPDIDAVVITTPVATHFAVAKDALMNGKDVLCEKPLTHTSAEARELVKIALDKKRILMVGHVFLFNPGIIKLKEVIDSKECGQTYYLHAERTNLGPVRKDVNAVYDLASHDIAIFNYLLGAKPKVISATGKGYLQPNVEDVAFVTLEYPGGILAHIHVSWLDPKKVRQITVVGSKKMVTWDDLAMNGPVEIFSKRIEREQFYKDYGEFHLLAKDGEVLIPAVKAEEPLKRQAEHFLNAILHRTPPLSDGKNGLEVVETLEAIQVLLDAARA